LETCKLNKAESIELARPVLQQGRLQLLEKWLKEDKLECSEQLGDMIFQFNADMALSIYLRAQSTEKVINCFMARGEFDKIVAYCAKVGYRPDWTFLLQNIARQNPKAAEGFAKKLVANEGGSLVETTVVVDVFLQMNCIQEATGFLLEALKANRPEDAAMQTRLLEINLMGGAPQVAEGILATQMFTHYDRQRVAGLAEKAGLFQRALEHYTDIEDIKRVVLFTHAMNIDWLVTYLSGMEAEPLMECLNLLMDNSSRQPNLNVVVQVATKVIEKISSAELIALFEKQRR
jgi:clathrin heavy chain